jgi:hypothetical protein
VHREQHRIGGPVGAGSQSSGHVHETQPRLVVLPGDHTGPRVGQQELQGLVQRPQLGVNRGDQVDAEQEPPEPRRRLHVRGLQVGDFQRLIREAGGRAPERDREPVVAACSHVHDAEDGLALVDPLPEHALPPPVGPRDAPDPVQRDGLVHVPHRREDLVPVEQAHRPTQRRAGPPPRALDPHVQVPPASGHTVAEPPVDPRLAGPQRRHRLTARRDIIELGPHHGRQQAAAGVIGPHADARDGRHREHGATGHHELARDGCRRGYQRPAVVDPECATGAVGRCGVGPPLVIDRTAVDRGGEERVGRSELVGLEDTDVGVHGV